jgi:predicted nucleic acid-binding Zn ribbon protein
MPPPGSRVRINKTFPYGDHGLEGTVVRTFAEDAVVVKLDGYRGEFRRHISYLDIISEPPVSSAPQCMECGEVWEPLRSDAKYCSAKCRDKANNRRRLAQRRNP